MNLGPKGALQIWEKQTAICLPAFEVLNCSLTAVFTLSKLSMQQQSQAQNGNSSSASLLSDVSRAGLLIVWPLTGSTIQRLSHVPGVWQLILIPIRVHFKPHEIMNYSINRVVMSTIIWEKKKGKSCLPLYSDTKIETRCILILEWGFIQGKTEKWRHSQLYIKCLIINMRQENGLKEKM